MSKENLKKQWASLEPTVHKQFEDLVLELLESKTPLFDKAKAAPDWSGQFAKDHEVQFLTFEFVSSLRKFWASRFPDAAETSPDVHLESESPAESLEFPKLFTDSESLPNDSLPTAMASEQSAIPDTQPLREPEPGDSVTNQPADENSDDSCLPRVTDDSSPSEDKITVTDTSAQTVAAADISATAHLKPGEIPSAPGKPALVPEAPPTFHLPNCKVGTPFSAKIEGTDKSGRQVCVAHLRFPDGFGLTFDPANQMVTGQPQMDGEFDLDLQWSFADAPTEGKATGCCKLTSNPDPRTLWKTIEPSADLPYPKLHLDQKLLKGNGFQIAAASRRGRSHEHGGSFRDDDFFISDEQESGWSVLIVADGAGSAKSSREGSRIAVETAGKQLVDNLTGELGAKISGYLAAWDSDLSAQNAIGTEFHYFFYDLAKNAIQAIEQEAKAQNASAKEYSTTLLVAAVKKDGPSTFLATFWMGDGAIAAYGPRGTVKLMGTPDGGEFAGQTRFLDRNALADQGFGKRVKVGRFENISSVILMTDGVSDPYFETDNGLANPEKWDVLWDEMQSSLSDSEPEQRLVEWLHFFKQGHHDDRTIAVLW